MIENVKKLLVKYNNQLVGILVEDDEGNINFQYSKKWIETGFSISPISLPLNSKVYRKEKCEGHG